MSNVKALVRDFMARDAYVTVNKKLAKSFGGDYTVAAFLSDLVSRYFWLQDQNKLEDDWFYHTIADVEENLGLIPYQQRRCIQELTETGYINTMRRGNPSKRYFKINFNRYYEFIENLEPSPPPVNVQNNKKCFYDAINETIEAHDYARLIVTSQNIPARTKDFIYAWGVSCNKVTPWKLSGKSYRQIKNYVDARYTYKSFDYDSMVSYFKDTTHPDIMDFIMWDRNFPEQQEEFKLTFDKWLRSVDE